jgi:mRNA interferase MazF
MQKDFDRWNKLKKAINASHENERVYFHEGDIWWARVGVNIGFQIDGKHRQFARPVIVLKKYNQYSFLALPLTTAVHSNRWRVASAPLREAILSQLRNLDSFALLPEDRPRGSRTPHAHKENGQPHEFRLGRFLIISPACARRAKSPSV